ncbi:MAG: YjbQ family protein [Cytophagaceae bacterium]|nr:YjbQ family protein [Cytophagaceae bacterium]
MIVKQQTINLGRFKRGYHLVTSKIESVFTELEEINQGIALVFIHHTSASLTLNENADPTVRKDLEMFLNELVPDGDTRYQHHDEGPDDMPAHVKTSLLGSSLTIPVKDGRFLLGTWQGIYLCEHRDQGEDRKVTITALGSK